MKLNTSLLQAITLGVAITTMTVAATSCEKVERKPEKETRETKNHQEEPAQLDSCPMCGMG